MVETTQLKANKIEAGFRFPSLKFISNGKGKSPVLHSKFSYFSSLAKFVQNLRSKKLNIYVLLNQINDKTKNI